MHGPSLGRELGTAEVLIPLWPGEFSAFGLLASDYRVELGRSVVKPLASLSADELASTYEELERNSLTQLGAQGVDPSTVTFQRWLDGMYFGQSWDTSCMVPSRNGALAIDDVARLFEAAYMRRWGTRLAMPIRVTMLRVTAIGARERPRLPTLPDGRTDPPARAQVGELTATLRTDGRMQRETIPVVDRRALRAKNRVVGPALVIQPTSTTVLLPGDVATVDSVGNLRVLLEEAA
jgi:N-methylhydantoinase A